MKSGHVTEARKGGKGHKVAWIDAEGKPRKSALDTMYARPKD